MHEQYLPTYTHDFLKDSRWNDINSPHYTFHYFAGSEAEKDVEKIAMTQEAAYVKIMTFLKLPDPNSRIEYFLYPDAETKKKLMGDDWYAQAIYDEFRVHVLYTADDKPLGPHEDTHLLSLPWGLSIGFFQEGMAEFMVGKAWDGKSHLEYVSEGYKQGMYCPISELISHNVWMEKSIDKEVLYWYSLAGAFTSFLINKYGKDKFEQLYRETSRKKSATDNELVFSSIYGVSTTNAQVEFRNDHAHLG